MGAAPPRPSLRPSHGSRARKGSGSGAAPASPSLRASRGDPERSEGLRTPGNVARDSQMLPKKAKFARRVRYLRRGEGSWAWTRRNLIFGSEIPERAPGPGRPEPPTGAKWRWGMAVLMQERSARRGSTGFRETDLWNCSAGEDPLPEPFGALLRKEAWSEGPRVLLQRNLTVEFSADVR